MRFAWAQRLHPGSFRGRLTLWFGLLSLTTLLSVSVYVGHIATQEIADCGGRMLHINARSAGELLATNLSERDKEIRLLRQTLALSHRDLHTPAVGHLLTLRQQSSNEYAWIGIADPKGTVIQATQGLLVGKEVNQRPWFLAALKAPYTGDVHEAVLLAQQLPQRDSL